MYEELVKLDMDGSYKTFRIRAKLRFQDLGLWKYIEGPEASPPRIPESERFVKTWATLVADNARGDQTEVELAKKDAELWERGNVRALCMIVHAVPDDMVDLFDEVKTAREAWKILQDERDPARW